MSAREGGGPPPVAARAAARWQHRSQALAAAALCVGLHAGCGSRSAAYEPVREDSSQRRGTLNPNDALSLPPDPDVQAATGDHADQALVNALPVDPMNPSPATETHHSTPTDAEAGPAPEAVRPARAHVEPTQSATPPPSAVPEPSASDPSSTPASSPNHPEQPLNVATPPEFQRDGCYTRYSANAIGDCSAWLYCGDFEQLIQCDQEGGAWACSCDARIGENNYSLALEPFSTGRDPCVETSELCETPEPQDPTCAFDNSSDASGHCSSEFACSGTLSTDSAFEGTSDATGYAACYDYSNGHFCWCSSTNKYYRIADMNPSACNAFGNRCQARDLDPRPELAKCKSFLHTVTETSCAMDVECYGQAKVVDGYVLEVAEVRWVNCSYDGSGDAKCTCEGSTGTSTGVIHKPDPSADSPCESFVDRCLDLD